MDTKKQSKKRKNFESSEPPKVSKKFKKEDAKEIEKETIGKYEQPSNVQDEIDDLLKERRIS